MTDDPIKTPSKTSAGPVNSYVFGQSIDLLLRTLPVCAKPFGGDMTRMLVFYSAARASVSHLNHHNKFRDEAVEGVFPDDLRRGVSILSLSEFLNLPYETVRRHMHYLVEQGWCERRGKREFFVAAEVMRSDAITRSITLCVPVIADFSKRLAKLRKT